MRPLLAAARMRRPPNWCLPALAIHTPQLTCWACISGSTTSAGGAQARRPASHNQRSPGAGRADRTRMGCRPKRGWHESTMRRDRVIKTAVRPPLRRPMAGPLTRQGIAVPACGRNGRGEPYQRQTSSKTHPNIPAQLNQASVHQLGHMPGPAAGSPHRHTLRTRPARAASQTQPGLPARPSRSAGSEGT
jgi:hypothetical protein